MLMTRTGLSAAERSPCSRAVELAWRRQRADRGIKRRRSSTAPPGFSSRTKLPPTAAPHDSTPWDGPPPRPGSCLMNDGARVSARIKAARQALLEPPGTPSTRFLTCLSPEGVMERREIRIGNAERVWSTAAFVGLFGDLFTAGACNSASGAGEQHAHFQRASGRQRRDGAMHVAPWPPCSSPAGHRRYRGPGRPDRAVD